MLRKMLRRILRKIGKLAIALVVAVVVVALAARASLELPSVRVRVASLLESVLTRKDVRVEIEWLGGTLPFAPTAERIEIADRGGVWLTIEGLRADFSALDLVSRRAHARVLAADRVTMLRRPLPDDDPFKLKPLRLVARVDRLDVRELKLGRGVLENERAAEWIGPLAVTGKGDVDLRRRTLDVELAASTSNAGAFWGEPAVASGTAELAVTARGAIQAPSGEVSLKATSVGLDDARLARLASRATVERLGMGERRYRIVLAANGHGLSGLPPRAAEMLGADATLATSVRFGHSPRIFDVDSLSLTSATFAADLVGSGNENGDVDISSFTVTWPDVSVVPTAAPWLEGGALKLRGKAGFSVAANTPRAIRTELALKGESLGFVEPRLQSLSGAQPLLETTLVSSDGKSWTAETLRLVGEKLRIGGSGAYDIEGGKAAADLEAVLTDLAALRDAEGKPDLAGALRAKWKGGGNREALDGTLELKPEGLRIGGGGSIDGVLTLAVAGPTAAPRGRLDAVMTMAGVPLKASGHGAYATDRRARAIDALTLATAGGKLDASGEVLTEARLASGTAKFVASDVSKLAPWVGLQGAGKLDGTIDLEHARGVQRARFAARGVAVRIVGMKSGPLEATTLGARGDIVDPLGRADGSLVGTATGAMWRDVSITTADLELDRAGGNSRFRANASGQYRGDFEAHAVGRHSGSRASGTAVLESFSGRVREHDFRIARPLELTTRGGEVAVRDVSLAVDGGSVEGAWGYGGARGVGRLRMTELPLDLVGLVSDRLSLGGHVSGEIERRTHGSEIVTALQSEDATVVTSGGAGAAQGFAVDLTASSSAWRSRISGKVRAATNPSTLDIVAELPIGFVGGTTRDPLRGRVSGALDADLIDDLLLPDNEHASGWLDVDLTLGGNLESPQVEGRVTGALDYASGATGMTLKLDEIELVADGARIEVVRLRGGDGRHGRVEGNGSVTLGGRLAPARYDLHVSFTDTYVAKLDEIELRGSGALALTGPGDSLSLSGSFSSNEATIRIPDRLPPDVATLPVEHVNLEASRRPAAQVEARPKGPPIELDVELGFPSRLRVEDPNLESEWRGTLFVRGDIAHPDIQGELQVVRGRFDLAGIRFTATAGRFTFEELTNVPMIDVTAVADRNDIEATLKLQGPANTPVVTLTSNPSLPQDEILSRLMFGETAGTLTAGQSIQLAQAAARLSGTGPGLGSTVLGRLRRFARVDRIEVKDSGDPQNAGTSVSVGKYIGDRVYLSYDQAVQGEGSKARVEVEMTKHLSAETEVGRNQNASVGLRWRWSY